MEIAALWSRQVVDLAALSKRVLVFAVAAASQHAYA
jgi:hypothetical protein